MATAVGMRLNSNSRFLQGVIVPLFMLLLGVLLQLQAVAATEYTVYWSYPNYENYFSNWNKGSTYVVGDSIGKFCTTYSSYNQLLMRPYFFQHALFLLFLSFSDVMRSFVWWELLSYGDRWCGLGCWGFICDMICAIWRVFVQCGSTQCGESEQSAIRRLFYQCPTSRWRCYCLPSQRTRDVFLHVHRPRPLRSRHEASIAGDLKRWYWSKAWPQLVSIRSSSIYLVMEYKKLFQVFFFCYYYYSCCHSCVLLLLLLPLQFLNSMGRWVWKIIQGTLGGGGRRRPVWWIL